MRPDFRRPLPNTAARTAVFAAPRRAVHTTPLDAVYHHQTLMGVLGVVVFGLGLCCPNWGGAVSKLGLQASMQDAIRESGSTGACGNFVVDSLFFPF